MSPFDKQLDAWVKKTDERILAVFRESTQRMVSLAQERIPVDTGYARASIRASLTEMPPLEDASSKKKGETYPRNDTAVVTTIAGAGLGQTIYIGWTANYVPYLENGHSKQAPNGFIGLALLEWGNIVDRVTEELKARVG
jgi:hypothetical protein